MNGFYIGQPSLQGGLPADSRVQVTGVSRRYVLTGSSSHVTGLDGEFKPGKRQQAGGYRPHQGEDTGHWGGGSILKQQISPAGEHQ